MKSGEIGLTTECRAQDAVSLLCLSAFPGPRSDFAVRIIFKKE